MTNFNAVKESIVNEMGNVLGDRDYPYSDYAINRIVDEWAERKRDLIELFSKHPNWNEKKMLIQFDTDIERNFDVDQVFRFANYLLRKYKEKHVGQFLTWESKIMRISGVIKSINCQFFNENADLLSVLPKINEINENYKIRPNMKCSKAIGKICREEGWDQFEDFNKEYAKFCDALNPLKIRRHTVISLNPLDFLLMSNGNSWSSCHDIGTFFADMGFYSSGTISYMLDENSFVFYTVDSSYCGENIELQPKIQRQIFGYNNGYLAQSRLYPGSNDNGAKETYENIRFVVQKVITDCLGVSNLWKRYDGDVENLVYKYAYATCYPDWKEGNPGASCCTVSYIKEMETSPHQEIKFGAEPICIECGCQHDTTYSILCCGYEKCPECGCVIPQIDAVYIDGEYYCSDCVEECDCCHEWILKDRITEIDGENVCIDCLEYSGDYWYCAECYEWHRAEDMVLIDEKAYCTVCYEYIKRESEREAS